MPNLHQLYLRLAKGSGPCPQPVQDATLSWALADGDVEVVAALAARVDATPAVLSAAASAKDVKVRVAYLSRPDRPGEELAAVLDEEDRVTVLVAVASSPKVARSVLSKLSEDPRKAVAAAVLANEQAPAAARERCLRTLAATFEKTPHMTQMLVRRHLDTMPHLHDEFVRSASPQLRTLLLGSPHLRPTTQLRLLTKLVADPLAAAPNTHDRSRALAALLQIAEGARAQAVVERVIELAALHAVNSHPELAKTLERFSSGGLNETLLREAEAVESSDATKLAALAALVPTLPASVASRLAGLLSANSNLCEQDLVALVPYLSSVQARQVLMERPTADVVVAAAVCFTGVLSRDLLMTLDGADHVLPRLVAHLRSGGNGASTMLATLLSLPDPHPSVVLDVPFHMLCEARRDWSTPVVAAVAEALTPLGGSAGAWAVFNALAADTAASLRELVEAATNLDAATAIEVG